MLNQLTRLGAISQHPVRRHNDRQGAAGKSLLVYLFSGSLGLAILAFILFKMIGW